MPLPLILAGPILRRVEPRLVTLWLALRESAQVRLSLWDNIANGGAGGGLFSGPPAKFNSAPLSTLRVCDNLHIALVTLDLSDPNLLLFGQIYSYNLTISTTGGGEHDLKSLGLLRDNIFDDAGEPVNGTAAGHLHAALGYGNGDLPSFAMPPPELTELRLLHYSCRRPHERGPDALSFVDKLIEADLHDASARPHLLFMTGDQIYADDVAMPLLPILTDLGRALLGTITETITGDAGPIEVNQANLPAGFRGEFLQDVAGFTTVSSSHLVSFGEFAAMYLAVWNNIFWPTPEPDGSFPEFKFSSFEDLLARIEPVTDELIPTWRELFRPPDSIGLAAGELELFLFHFFTTLPRDTLLKFLDKTDQFDSETLQKKQLAKVDGEEYKTYQLTYDFARSMSDERLKRFEAFVEWLQGLFLGKEEASKEQLGRMKLLYDTLPQVRRAMANVPCYMMWDDHDITDDWYLTKAWRDQVLTKDAGMTILRNGMVAGALFQLWGNDPKSFLVDVTDPTHPDSIRAEFLTKVQDLYPDGASEVSLAAVEDVNKLLGLDGAEPPPLKWHFSLDGPRYGVLVLDTRTRRTFLGRFTPPGLLSDGAIKDQIPEISDEPLVHEVLFVVSPVPVLGPPIDEEIARPLAVRFTDMKAAFENRPPEGQINMDMEWWSARPETLEKLFARLEPYKKIVFLSGDVHHGLGSELDYWKEGEAQPARFLQFTSSPAKNILPMREVVPIAGSFAFAQRVIRLGFPVERMAWEESDPSPVSVSGGQLPTPRLRALLRREPVLIPTHPWPAGTSAVRPADWRWRHKQLRDERPDNERPKSVRPIELPPDFDTLPRLEQYSKLMERHLDYVNKNFFGRVFVFTNHIGLVRFSNTDDGLEARHELHTIHPDQSASGKPLAYTIHRALLEPTSDAPPELS
jgi:hypothetical protein